MQIIAAKVHQLDMHVVWSLNQLAAGHTFPFDAWGQTIAGHQRVTLASGFKAVLSGIKGDQVFIRKTLNLARSWVSRNVCMHCEVGP